MLTQTFARRLVSARPTGMPLRAKILNPAMQQCASRPFASSSEIREEPGDEHDDVLFNIQGGVRSITLNRPKKLNSLNGSMCRKIIPRLREWSRSDLANVIVIKGEGRAFCAGGDVAWLAEKNKQGEEGQQSSKDYFALEYKLDHLIATYKKPYVAFLDGITMGGGVGLSIHAPFRIATENTVFAMPETTIGFFPDVGASFFLPRLMDGDLGTYCALTSEQLKGAQVFYAGIATHYIHSSSLPDLETRLAELQFKDDENMASRIKVINRAIEEFATGLPSDEPISAPVGGNVRKAIDYIFQPSFSIQQSLAELEKYAQQDLSHTNASEVPAWAAKTKEQILQRSPTSVTITLRLLRQGRDYNIVEAFRCEHAIASRFMEHPDFVEGVSALLIEKPKRKPKWTPDTLDAVSSFDIDSFFQFKTEFETLDTSAGSSGSDYSAYPYSWIALPREYEVRLQVQRLHQWKAVVRFFLERSDDKMGVKEKVEEILTRKTTPLPGNALSWIN